MWPKAVLELSKVLGRYTPGWVLAILTAIILAYQSPNIVRELFVGIGNLLK